MPFSRETTEAGDSIDAFVAQQADGIKADYISAVANAAGGAEDDSDDEDDAESDEDAI